MNSLFYGGYYYGSGFNARYLKKNLRDEIWANPKFQKLLIQKWKKDPKYDPKRVIPAGLLVKYYFEIPQIREHIINHLADYENTLLDPETGKLVKTPEVMKTVSINPIKTSDFNPQQLINVFKPQAEQSMRAAYSKMQAEGPKDFVIGFKRNFLEKMKDVPKIPVEGFFAPEEIKKEPSESILNKYTFDQLVRYVSENMKDKPDPNIYGPDEIIGSKLFNNIINCIKKNRAKRLSKEAATQKIRLRGDKLRRDKLQKEQLKKRRYGEVGKILYDIQDYVNDQIKKYEDVALSFIEISQDEGIDEDIINEITSVITEEVDDLIKTTINDIIENTPETSIGTLEEGAFEVDEGDEDEGDEDEGDEDNDLDLKAIYTPDDIRKVYERVLKLVQQLHQYLGLTCPSKSFVNDFTREEVFGNKLSDLQIVLKYGQFSNLDKQFEIGSEDIKKVFGGCNLRQCPKKRNLRNYY